MPEMTDDLERWRAFRAQFVEMTSPQRACRLPTPADIEELEGLLGYRLPASYRGFTQVFGPGTLIVGEAGLRLYAPYAPEKPPAGSIGASLLRGARAAREARRAAGRPDGAEEPRSLGFADTEGFNVFGWNIDDLTDPEAPEYGVYCFRRYDGPVKMARTFEGFIRLFTNPPVFKGRMNSRNSGSNVGDPTFDFFRKADGSDVLGPRKRPLERLYMQMSYDYSDT